MADESRSRLGRGLAALMGDVVAETKPTERSRHHRRVPIEYLKPNPRNPRRSFSDSDLEELAASIRQRGVIQPVLVRPIADSNDTYEIIAGERRWRAAQRAGLHEIPIVPLEATDAEALELAIIENVQRTDLNALEEAGGYQRLASEYGHSHEAIAHMVGKSRSHVSNTMRLLKLPETVKAYISAGEISAGAARMLVAAPDPEGMARQIVERSRRSARASPQSRQRAEQTKAPTPPRSSSGFPTRLASPSLSPSVATGECCTSTSAVSISSRTWCAGWRRIRAWPLPLR
jgi:ParB family chromosome partitioning protein